MYTKAKSFYLPDLLALSKPFRGSTNPHYRKAAAESRAWVNSYNIFTDRKRAFFVQDCSELLVSHAYPHAGYEEFRTICDFVNLLFVIDEVSDDQNGMDARKTGDVYLNAMRHPAWTDGFPLAKMTREYALMFPSQPLCHFIPDHIYSRFRERLTHTSAPRSFRRFLRHSEDYIECVAREAEYRERGEVLDMESFKHLRRENSAIRLCFCLLEYSLGIDLPDDVFENPVFASLYWAAVDMVFWANVRLSSPPLPPISYCNG
jgi:Terpene synthase family 2, C-terminal metal binding